MTDEKKPEDQSAAAGGDNDKAKAKAEKAAKIEAALAGGRQASKGEQLLIWVLIIVVGVLFSMTGGASIFSMQQGGQDVRWADVSRTDALRMQGIEKRVQQAIVPQWAWRFRPPVRPWQSLARELSFARMAEDAGLLPRGETLDEIVVDFLKATNFEGKKHGDILADLSGEDRVTKRELREWLQMQNGARNMMQRYVMSPVVSDAVAKPMIGLSDERIDIDVVKLTPESLLAKHTEAVSDADLQKAYESLREKDSSYLRIPASRGVIAYYVDKKKMRDHIFVSQEKAEAHYEAHKMTRYAIDKVVEVEEKKDDKADAEKKDDKADDKKADDKKDEKPKPKKTKTIKEPKPFKDVHAEIIDTLKDEWIDELAQRVKDDFMTAVESVIKGEELQAEPHKLPLEKIDALIESAAVPPDSKRISKALTMSRAELRLSQAPDGENIQFLDQGEIKVDADVFQARIPEGSIREGHFTDDKTAQPILFRLVDFKETDHKALDAIKDELRIWVAGRKAYDDLLKSVPDIKKAATLAGGLKPYFDKDEIKKQWKTEAKTLNSQPMLSEFSGPAETIDGSAGDSFFLLSLARPDKPIQTAGFIGGGTKPQSITAFQPRDVKTLSDELPEIMLIQVRAYHQKPTEGTKPTTADAAIQQFKQMIDGAEIQEVQTELQRRTE